MDRYDGRCWEEDVGRDRWRVISVDLEIRYSIMRKPSSDDQASSNCVFDMPLIV